MLNLEVGEGDCTGVALGVLNGHMKVVVAVGERLLGQGVQLGEEGDENKMDQEDSHFVLMEDL